MKTRSVAFAVSLVLALVVVGCSTGDDVGQSQQALQKVHAPVYLALGDSISFGENPPIEPAPNANWYVGYPEYLATMIDKPHVNAACPGETTASMYDPTAGDNGCDAFKARESLHVAYSGTQYDYAMQYVATHDNVKLITVQLGANDLLLLLYGCLGDMGCVMQQLPAVLGAVGQNLGYTVGSLRAAGYTGQIILPLYYSTNYADQFTTGAIYYLNQVITQVAAATGAQTADVFGAWFMASYAAGGDPCAAGLLLPLEGGGCDKHPSPAGAQLIAQVVASAVAP
jgi:lysophospholipase L1-like esterase